VCKIGNNILLLREGEARKEREREKGVVDGERVCLCTLVALAPL